MSGSTTAMIEAGETGSAAAALGAASAGLGLLSSLLQLLVAVGLYVWLALALSAVFWLDTLSYALRNGASLLG